MAIFKKNIWLIFYILTFFATFLLVTVLYLKWQNIYLKYQSSQENLVELVGNATHSMFNAKEQLIDVLGVGILQDNHHLYNTSAIEEHASPILNNPSVIALGITTPEGDFIYASSEKNPKNAPNLLQQSESRLSFLEALQSHGMVFGRTYFSNALQKWGMPIRKAIRDKEGNPVFVITIVLKLNGSLDHFLNTIHHKQNSVVSIIRDVDTYQQYNSLGTNDPEKFYSKPFPKEVMDAVYKIIFDTFQLTSEAIKKQEKNVSFTYKHLDGTYYLASLKYNQHYQLWTIVHTYIETIINDFIDNAFYYIFMYFAAGLLFFCLFRYIATAEARRRYELLFQATHDQLTTLPNRSYLQQTFPQWISSHTSFHVLYVDMDHFKNINDSFGHQFGDYVLIEIARRLRSHLNEHVLISRYGGDEFVLLLPNIESHEIVFYAKTIIDVLSAPYVINELHFDIGASIGIARYPEHGENLDMLLRAADIALYESKKIKNSAHLFASTMQEGFLKNIKIEQELRKALKQHKLFMVYQPQIDAQGNFFGVEALLRWNSQTLGNIPPNDFIPLAEASGLMPKMGRFIIETVCEQMKSIQTELNIQFHVSINISIRQFMEPTFLEHLCETIEKTKISHLCLTLEVTENLFIEDINYILPLLEQIRKLGLHISMDDFGTGYSSLSMLRRLPINELKIDKSFVDEICQNHASSQMIQNIIAIAKNFDMYVLAEGVETEEQKEALISFGCDRFQGYYFSKPLMTEDLIAFIKTKTDAQTIE